jgi:alanyl-tRNA synthetase
VSDDDLQNVMKITNEIVESGLPVYRATLPLRIAKRIPGIVFMSDEVCPFISNSKV